MINQFAGSEVPTNSLRAELVTRSNSGDRLASKLLKSLADRSEENAADLVSFYRRRAGSQSLETAIAAVGLLSIGLILGIVALTVFGAVSADVETLLILGGAFVVGQWALKSYNKMSSSRLYAQEFQKMANILKVSDMVKAQYAEANRKLASQKNLQLAYG